jgi:hypothetical protein
MNRQTTSTREPRRPGVRPITEIDSRIGIDIKIVQELLGHSTSTITRDTYTAVTDEIKHAAATRITHIITGTTSTGPDAGPATAQRAGR